MGRRRVNGVANAASCLELQSLGAGSVSTASVCSAFSYLDGDMEDIQLDEFEKKLDALFEKRGSTREKALESLAVMLRVDYRDSDCTAHNETITSRCLMSLKRGSAVESSLASQLLGLHVLTLGQPDEGLFAALRPELARSASGANGGGPAVQIAAVESLALAAFVLAEDEAGTREVMDKLRGLWGKGDPKVRAAAVRGWSFLLTCLNSRLADDQAVACLAALARLLHERDLDLRTAAGEAVAVLRSSCPAGMLAALAEEEEEDGEGDGGEGAGGEEGADGEETGGVEGEAAGGGGQVQPAGGGRAGRRGAAQADLGGLVGQMQELASNKGDKLRRSRRDRASQRATFRGLLAALSGEALPEYRIKLQHGDSLTVEGVAATHQLAFLRRFLAGGFQAHLQHNPLLHDVFGFSPRTERPERMTAAEKRLTRSCHSVEAKARSAQRQWCRDAKASRMGMGY